MNPVENLKRFAIAAWHKSVNAAVKRDLAEEFFWLGMYIFFEEELRRIK